MMDETLKRRLVGVAVLGLLGVIFVPMLLDGPDWQGDRPGQQPGKPVPPIAEQRDSGTERRVRVTLDGNGATPLPDLSASETRAAEPVAAERRDRPLPVPVPAATATVASEARDPGATRQPEPASAERRPVPIDDAPAASTPALRQGDWLLQVGSFSSEANASRLVANLQSGGAPAYQDRWQSSTRTLYRVRVGPLPSRAEADQLAASINRKHGLKPRVMQVD